MRFGHKTRLNGFFLTLEFYIAIKLIDFSSFFFRLEFWGTCSLRYIKSNFNFGICVLELGLENISRKNCGYIEISAGIFNPSVYFVNDP